MVDFNEVKKTLAEKRKAREISLEDRLRASIKQKGVDMNPAPPPRREPEHIPDLREAITNPADRLKLSRFLNALIPWKQQEKEAKAQIKPITAQIKNILGSAEVGKCTYDGWRINYFESTRTVLSEKRLLELGVSPVTIQKAKVKGKESFTLKITAEGEDDENEG